jgi:hypothetical protein
LDPLADTGGVARDGIADVHRMRLLGGMQERTSFFQALAVVMALTLLTSCERPSANPADLKAIKAKDSTSER